MATILQQGDRYYCYFVHYGKRFSFPLGKVKRSEADAKADQVDYLLLRLKQGLLHVPPGMDIIQFLQSDGKPAADAPLRRDETTLAFLRDAYFKSHDATLERSTVTGMAIHFRHLIATLGERFPLERLTLADLQRHADRRHRMLHRGRPIGPATIKKELVTLRTVWNWGRHFDFVEGSFPPLKRVTLAKVQEKPPFQTRQEIERQVALGGLDEAQTQALWQALYIRPNELAELLRFVKGQKRAPWLYPLVATAAYTGMRRSELIRAEIGDVDFNAMTLVVRERKRKRGERTTRRVSLLPALKAILQAWLKVHPGGRALFCHGEVVAHSKKRSELTGFVGKGRPTTSHGRLAGVHRRLTVGTTPLTQSEVQDHFRRCLKGTKWEVLPGLHCLRHSFVSCLASSGCDQRIIDEFVGHQTDEQRQRYRHIFPEKKGDALRAAFG
jgi:integrase